MRTARRTGNASASIRSFHIDALASSVPLNVDLDVVLSVLAGSYGYRRRLPAIMGTEGVGRDRKWATLRTTPLSKLSAKRVSRS
jgi:hypothetical protein